MFIAIGLKAQAFNLFIHLPSAESALTTRNKPTKQWFFCCIKNKNTKLKFVSLTKELNHCCCETCVFLQINIKAYSPFYYWQSTGHNQHRSQTRSQGSLLPVYGAGMRENLGTRFHRSRSVTSIYAHTPVRTAEIWTECTFHFLKAFLSLNRNDGQLFLIISVSLPLWREG